jgi:hypothetical protein
MTDNSNRAEREARLKWVPIEKMRIQTVAQRDRINWARVDKIAASFDLEQLGTPTVVERDGLFYVIDGMHRVEALKKIGYGDQQIQCWTYHDLTDEQMAERFLKLNDTLAVSAFDKFRIGVNAGRPIEADIDRIVRHAGLHVGRDKQAGSVSCVGTLRKVYERGGPGTLSRTLHLIRDAYGDAGLDAPVIEGIGLLCQRYNGELDVPLAVQRLANAHGGVSGLLGKAQNLRLQTGNQLGQCVAAAAVEIINSGRGGKKLPSWWRSGAPA